MTKFKIGIKFDKRFLNTLTENSNSGVELRRLNHHLALHPIHLNDFNKSIKNLLNYGIAKYNKNLDGLLLGYQNIKLPKDIGIINNDSCYIHIDLEADFFIFKPEIGKEIQGVVNRKSKDHVGVLVYGAFNVSIPKLESDENWLGSTVNIGCEVLFKITYINLSSYLPYIRGDLMSIITEVDPPIDSKKQKKVKTKKKSLNKRIIFEDEPLLNDMPVLNKSKKQKSHKNKSPSGTHKTKQKAKKVAIDSIEDQFSDSQNFENESNEFESESNEFENELEEAEKPLKKKKLKRKVEAENGITYNNLNLSVLDESEILPELDANNESGRVNIKEKKIKKKKKSKEQDNEALKLSESLDNTRIEEKNSSLPNIKSDFAFENGADFSKNFKKRRHSFSEPKIPTKKLKRKSN